MDPRFLNTVSCLIEIDKTEQPFDAAEVRRLSRNKGYPSALPYSRELAAELADSLGESDLRHLIRGLVRYSAEAGPHSSGGSVSPVITLYAEFAARYPQSEPELTAWIVRNRVNEYEPFGTRMNADALSLAEHRRLREERRLVARENLSIQRDIADSARIKAAKEATERLPNAVRRGDLKALEALLAKGADPKVAAEQVGSLQVLATENGRDAVAEFLATRGID